MVRITCSTSSTLLMFLFNCQETIKLPSASLYQHKTITSSSTTPFPRKHQLRFMKREGWQRGVPVVRSPSLHLARHPASIDTGSCYTKAPPARRSNSKQTGKCRRPRCAQCHSLPVSKSRDKAKGAHKLRSCNVKLNHKLVSWRVVDNRQRPKLVGASASDLLSQLSGCYLNEEDDHEDEVHERGDQFHECASHGKNDEEDFKEDEDKDDDMGFCEVGFIMEYLEREEWCMVYEI